MSPSERKNCHQPLPDKPSPKQIADELIARGSEIASANGHVLKPWSIWPGTKFYLAECKLCGANAIADPTFKSYESGHGGGAIQFHCRAAIANPKMQAVTTSA